MKGSIEMTKAVLRQQSSFVPKLVAIILAASAKGVRGENLEQIKNQDVGTTGYIQKVIDVICYL